MRREKVIKNVLISFLSQLVGVVLGFITRKILIKTLGLEMIGVMGVFNNLLAMLGVAELGIGTGITYNLYEPLAEDNKEKVAALMRLYKQVYRQIGCIILGIGFITMFFIPCFLRDTSQQLSFLRSIYIVQVIGVSLTYFLGYKRTLISSDQKEYICVKYEIIIRIIATILQIMVLVIYKNYLIYLLVGILQGIVTSLIIINKCNKLYPYLNKYGETYKQYRGIVYKDIKNIGIAKVSNYVYGSTDNLIISVVLGVIPVGKLANYTMIVSIIRGLTDGVMAPIQVSIGNMISESKSKNKPLEIFQVYTLIRFIVASFCVTSLIVLIQPFLTLWLGTEYLLPMSTIILICIDFYIAIVHGCIWQYMNGAGLFRYEKYISIIGMLVNIVASIVLVRKIGVNGVLIGTVIAHLFYWSSRAYVVFSYYFKQGILSYLRKVVCYIVLTMIEICVTSTIGSKLVQDISINGFAMLCVLCLVIPNTLNIICFYRTKEMKYLRESIQPYVASHYRLRKMRKEI